MRGVSHVAALVLGVALIPGAGGPASAEAPSCQGRRATIVGHADPDGTLLGTAGDDVIVTRGIGMVRAGAGADRICVTGTNSARGHFVDAGTGDDRIVVSTARPDSVEADLGQGEDVFRGGAGNDFVPGDGSASETEERDRISTGAGHDEINIGTPGVTTRDAVDLGGGDDLLEVHGLLAPEVRPQGGGGADTLWIRPGVPGHAWAFDNVAETARMDGVVQSRWAGFERFELNWLEATTVSFTGGRAAERVSAPSVLDRATMGGGDDSLTVALPRDGRVLDLRGGTGRDFFSAIGTAVTVDLAVGAAWDDTVGSRSAPNARLTAFDGAGGLADDLRLIGDAGDNLLAGAGCEVTASGGRGDDRIRSTWEYDWFACSRAESVAVFSGGPGRDVLTGGSGPDRLRGGPGHDTAVGRKGRDLCRAEVRRGCEVR